MSFWRNVNPAGAVGDFITVWRNAGPGRWRVAVLAALTTTGIFSIMAGENWIADRQLPEITYITSFAPDRSDEEIMAENKANQIQKEKLAAQEEERARFRRDIYKTFGRVTGMDVDAIEAKAKADQAAEDAAQRARIEAQIEQQRQNTLGDK